MKLLVYSHDAFGLGNIRRMLAICEHLLQEIPQISILVLSGSPALHSLRLPAGLDYIKLPCVGRNTTGQLDVKYLYTSLDETIQLRSHLIQTACSHFQPDVFLVDKKPLGFYSELALTLEQLKLDPCKCVLMLRDILDTPETTVQEWQQKQYYQAVSDYYDQVWVAGTPEIFDVRQEYQFPPEVAEKVQFCGYIRRGGRVAPSYQIRSQLGLASDHTMVLVTAGGGGDGESLLKIYLQSYLSDTSLQASQLQHILVTGPDMPLSTRQTLWEAAREYPQVQVIDFTADMESYMNAADVVVAMGGYNTFCEIVSLQKQAVIVPRCQPVQEQLLRIERVSHLDLFQWIHPDQLTPNSLATAVLTELQAKDNKHSRAWDQVDLNALPRITSYLHQLLPVTGSIPTWIALPIPDFYSPVTLV